MAQSTLKCKTALLVEGFVGCLKIESFAGAIVEFVLDGGDFVAVD